jgi:hypothetical protein
MFHAESAFSQTWEVGVTAGSMAYTGDLNQHKFYDFTDLAIGANVKRNFDGYWSLKFNFLAGKVRGDDAKSKYLEQRERNLNFYSPVTEGSLLVEFNFFDYGINFGQKRVTPFIYSGLAVFGFNPKTTIGDDVYELKYYGTEGQELGDTYKTISTAIPVGAGVKFRLSDYLNIMGEFGIRTTQTDFLDDVSGRYPVLTNDGSRRAEIREILSDRSYNNIGAWGTQRGDFRKKDTYLFAGITLSYTFVRQNCPF